MAITITANNMLVNTHKTYNVQFFTQDIYTTVTADPAVVTDWIDDIKYLYHLPRIIVGLDVEWNPYSQAQRRNPVATLQLCVHDRCLIYQIIHSNRIPESLAVFLSRQFNYILFFGVGIKEDLEKLQSDYGIGGGVRYADLRGLAAEAHEMPELERAGLKQLASVVLRKEVEKPDAVRMSRWDARQLTVEQRANSPHHSSQRAILVDHRFFSRFFPAVDRRLEFNSWRFRGLEAMETAARGTGIIATGENLPAFKLLVSSPEGLSPSEVSVVFDQKYDRIPHPDMSLENSVAEMWERRVQQNPSLFNGLKFRYGGHTLGNGPDSSQKTNVCIHLGLTDYRTFVGTNLNPLWERFLIPSEDDWRRCQHTSNPLGNGAIVETSNKEVVILQRSANVGEFPEHFVFPGGHPEPKEVGIEAHQMDGNLTQQMVDKRVSLEMFDSIIREVVEEIGVPSATLSKPLFIGISQRVLNVRPAAFFFIKCSLPSEEVQQFYSNAEDGYESTKLYTMPTSDLSNVTSKMPGCHQFYKGSSSA